MAEGEIFMEIKPPIIFKQSDVDHIVARAQNSFSGLGEPDKGKGSYDLSQYAHPQFYELALLLVSAHHDKYDIVSIVAAALEEVHLATAATARTPAGPAGA